MKQIKTWIGLAAMGLFLLALFAFRPCMIEAISESQRSNQSTSQKDSTEMVISQRYNYTQNKGSYSYTFLEFGSIGCIPCKQMEAVLEQIKTQFAGKVNVVFMNVNQKENKQFIKYYGIDSIPTQVLLDKNGKECYRHTGFISAEDLAKQFK